MSPSLVMKMNPSKSVVYFLKISACAIYIAGLSVFYWRYVPLVAPFQAALIPLLAGCAVLTAARVWEGTLLFVFLFPIINNLPYLFGIHEPLPHAPTALVLFLFYFLGWQIHYLLRSGPPPNKPAVMKPVLLLMLVVASSALVTFLRYTNYFPVLIDSVYEWTTNVQGVTTGGAVMSVVFNALSYLTGLTFFCLILRQNIPDRGFQKLLGIFGTSALLSAGCGLYQHFVNIRFGNNPTSISQGLINGSLKDAMSFGAFLSVLIPLFLGIALASRGMKRGVAVLLVGVSAFLLLSSGSKSALLGVVMSLILFLVLGVKAIRGQTILQRRGRKRKPVFLAAIGVSLILVTVVVPFHRRIIRRIANTQTGQRIEFLLEQKKPSLLLRGRLQTLWRAAWTMIKDYPLTGVGIGAYIIEYSNYMEAFRETGWVQREVQTTFDKGVRRIQPYCLLYSTTGTVWFDDLYIRAEGKDVAIPNGGMEEGGDVPSFWKTIQNDLSGAEAWSAGEAHGGRRSLKIANSSAGQAAWLSEAITLKPPFPRRFVFGGWAKSRDIAEGGLFALDFYVEFEDGTFAWYYDGLEFTRSVRPDPAESSENYFLQIGSELGCIGIFFVIWIFWEIIKLGMVAYRRSLYPDRNKAIFIGILTALFSFFINFQFHSYIGSYEIKYTLWFLIGLLACLSRLPKDEIPFNSPERLPLAKAVKQAEGEPFRGWLSFVAIALIVVYGAVLFGNSTHSLSLQSRTETLGLVQDFGWYAPEKTPEGRDFRWSREYGATPVKIDKSVLSIPIRSGHPDIAQHPISVRFFLVKELFKSKRMLKEITIADNDWKNIDLPVAEEIGNEGILLIKISRTWNPQKVSGIPDPRNLGIAVGKVESKDQ